MGMSASSLDNTLSLWAFGRPLPFNYNGQETGKWKRRAWAWRQDEQAWCPSEQNTARFQAFCLFFPACVVVDSICHVSATPPA